MLSPGAAPREECAETITKEKEQVIKRIVLIAAFCLSLGAPSWMMAQSEYNHGELGVFADYFRLGGTSPQINFVGLGGRAGFNVGTHVALEAEMSYDFKRNFTSTFSNGATTQLVNTRVRPPSACSDPASGQEARGRFGPSSPARWALSTSALPIRTPPPAFGVRWEA
jgi:hypothetical protein